MASSPKLALSVVAGEQGAVAASAAARQATGETKTLFQRAANYLSRAAKTAHRRILGTGEGRTRLGRAKNAVGHFLGGRTRFYNKSRSWGNFARQIFSRKARNSQRERSAKARSAKARHNRMMMSNNLLGK